MEDQNEYFHSLLKLENSNENNDLPKGRTTDILWEFFICMSLRKTEIIIDLYFY